MSLDPVTALLDVGSKVIDRLWPDPTQQAQAKLELFKLQQSGELQQIAGQLDIDKAEASNPSLFVSGWRPGVGWVCVAAFAEQFVVGPLGQWLAPMFGYHLVFPQLDMGTMMPLLFGMLGLGYYRTQEKIAGVATK